MSEMVLAENLVKLNKTLNRIAEALERIIDEN